MESGVGIASVAFRHKRRFVRRMLFGDSCDAKVRRWGEDYYAGVSKCACSESSPSEKDGKGEGRRSDITCVSSKSTDLVQGFNRG